MRWFLVAIVAYLCLVVQTAAFRVGDLAVPVGGHWARPDLLLVVGLFLAMFYRPGQVFVAAWFLGLAADMAAGAGRLGLLALEYSILLALVSFVPRGPAPDAGPRAVRRGAGRRVRRAAGVVPGDAAGGWHVAVALLGGRRGAARRRLHGRPGAVRVLAAGILGSPLGIAAQVTPGRR